MEAGQTTNINSRSRWSQRRKNKVDSEIRKRDRFIDSDTEHFLYFPEDENNLSERTQDLSPDIVLFAVLAGD